jgi:hypothetical protein
LLALLPSVPIDGFGHRRRRHLLRRHQREAVHLGLVRPRRVLLGDRLDVLGEQLGAHVDDEVTGRHQVVVGVLGPPVRRPHAERDTDERRLAGDRQVVAER